MSLKKFFIVDVFAQKKYSGNQVAIIVHEKSLDDAEMRNIAQEMKFPETCFILEEKNENNGYDIRIFTPNKEVSFSGHPTLGAAFIINNFLSVGSQEEISLNLKSGKVVIDTKNLGNKESTNIISKNKPILLSQQKTPEFGHIFEPVLLSRVLNIEINEIDEKFPIQEVTIGLGYIIVPLKKLSVIKKININSERYNWLISRTKAKIIFVFCPETVEEKNDVHVRVFANFYGIDEDAATGGGNASLASYMVKYKYFDSDNVNIRIEQGYEIGRKSLILAKAQIKDNKINVSIGGKVILSAQGKLI